MIEKIYDIGLKIMLSWFLTIGCIGEDLLLLCFLIGLFRDTIIGGILVSIPIITFIIILSITCFYLFIDTWKE
jgi:hypothetical protein